jgi:hypothetical protein
MIDTIKETIKGILGIEKKIDEEDLECAIDEDVVDCKEMEEEPYVGVPAPVVLIEDSWFGPAVVSDANKDYMELEYEAFKQDALNYYPDSKEPENIHQMMYEMATKSGSTTVQLDPIGGSENFQGGSENVHR